MSSHKKKQRRRETKRICGLSLQGTIALVVTFVVLNRNTKVKQLPRPTIVYDIPALKEAFENAVGNSTSMRILLNNLLAPSSGYIDDDEEIIVEREAQRCQRFNFEYNNRTARRRIFAGGMLADDSFHILGIHAMEARGIYTNYAFVESNRTHIYVPRTMRFLPSSPNKLLLEHIFGPSTKVTVDYYMVDEKGNVDERKFIRDPYFGQQLHRNVVLSMWKKVGMQPDDIGIILDVDEMFSRDFLRAMQICELPELRSGQSCRNPKIVAKSFFFDASLQCARDPTYSTTQTPSAILGECIEGIGDELKHGLAKRVYKERLGYRQPGYGGDNNWTLVDGLPNSPLWNGVDFRRIWGGGRQILRTNVKHDLTGFHINNFFLSGEEIRFKFSTYGDTGLESRFWLHGHVFDGPLGKLGNEAVGRLLLCAASNSSHSVTGKDKVFGLESLTEGIFPTPQAFKLRQYVSARHEELLQLVKEDEAKYGHYVPGSEIVKGMSFSSNKSIKQSN